MLTFSKSSVDKFVHRNKVLRWGQAFHRQFKLDKVTNPQDKAFCDKLYNADESTAKAMIQSRLDRNS
jgi:hypothetical protein